MCLTTLEEAAPALNHQNKFYVKFSSYMVVESTNNRFLDFRQLAKSAYFSILLLLLLLLLATVTYNQVHTYQVNLLQQIFKAIVTACMY